MIKKKIIVHLGLPKTATTTLQQHLFQQLHEDGKINFLGKLLLLDKNTGRSLTVNNKGKIIRDACEGKITSDIRNQVDNLLRNDVVNLFSDEGLMIYYPNYTEFSLEEKLIKLKDILKDYDVQVLLSLRNPNDYFYSLYVQLFSEYHKQNKDNNTFDKYIATFIKEPDNVIYETFRFQKVLTDVTSLFHTKVVLFEDLKSDPDFYYNEIAELLGVNSTEVKSKLEEKHENKKETSGGGKYSSHSFLSYIIPLFKGKMQGGLLHYLAKTLYRFSFIKTFLNKQRQVIKSHHSKPNKEQFILLSQYLLFDGDFIAEQYSLDKEKLIQYGYYRTPHV
jgi:hypothetical protein